VRVIDEIDQYVTGRYISCVEAAWRILALPTHERSHSVVRLPVHLENQHQVVVHALRGNVEALEAVQGQRAVLTAWFTLNQLNQASSRRWLNAEIPEHSTWNQRQKKWQARRQGRVGVGRIRFVPPSAGDVFFLRLLLNHVRSASSYEDLRRFHGQVYPNFRSACLAQGSPARRR
jgi:hypothetical protein